VFYIRKNLTVGHEAEAALLSRLSFEAFNRVSAMLSQYHHKLPARQVAQLALQFTFIVKISFVVVVNLLFCFVHNFSGFWATIRTMKR